MDENEITPEVETTETETSLRDDIQASLAELTAEPADTPEPVVADQEPVVAESESDRVQRERDEKGRFKSRTAAGPAGAVEPAAEEKPAEAAPAAPAGAPVAAEPKPAEPAEKAPQSWKPMAREHWAKLAPEVRQEVVRREQDHNRLLQETAEARRTHSQFQEVIRPFEAMIRAEAGDPMRGIQNLLGAAYNLRTGSPQQKAQIAAGIIQAYGVDIDTLAAALDGKAAPAASQPAPVYDPRVDQIYQRMQAAEQARQQATIAAAQSQLDEARGQFEFFDDLRTDMAEIMEVKSRQGQKITLKQAYERALAMSEEHQKIIRHREAAKTAASATAQTQRARAASSSVKTSHTVAPPRSRADTSLREDLEETLRELQRT